MRRYQLPEPTHSRRAFLGALGLLSASELMTRPAWPEGTAADTLAPVPRGLAASPGDFTFKRGLVYLQTGSLGPTPRPVVERTVAAWRELELNPSAYGYGPHEVAMDKVREQAAQFIGCKTEELILTKCTTEGMNWVAQGLTFAAGDRVLTTDQEHPGGRMCWDYVARRYGTAIDTVVIPPGEHDAQAIIDRFARQITSRTRVLSFSHLLSSTGLRMPVAELSALARSRGCIAVVDGAQAVGGMDVNVKALGCHVYVTSGHKWLMAPKGTGLLYLSEELGTAIDPIALQGGRAAYTQSSGVTSIPSVLGLAAAMDYITAIGKARVESYNIALRNRLFGELASVPRLRIVSAAPGPLASPLLTVALPAGVAAPALQLRLREKHNIEVKVVPKNWFNGNRFSTHLFNTREDVLALVHALKEELAGSS